MLYGSECKELMWIIQQHSEFRARAIIVRGTGLWVEAEETCSGRAWCSCPEEGQGRERKTPGASRPRVGPEASREQGEMSPAEVES